MIKQMSKQQKNQHSIWEFNLHQYIYSYIGDHPYPFSTFENCISLM